MSNRQRVRRRPRNQPCPCGSGLKAKRCCGLREAEARARHLRRVGEFDRERELLLELLRRAERWHGAEGLDACLALLGVEDELDEPLEQLVLPWLAWMARFPDGQTLPERSLREGLVRDERERALLEAQQRAWLSVWEVSRVLPGREGFELRDLLTGEVRRVGLTLRTGSLAPRSGLLARVVDQEEGSRLAGRHGRALSPRVTARLVQLVRKNLDADPAREPETLRGAAAARLLVSAWETACRASDEASDPFEAGRADRLPEFVRAQYLFLPEQRGAVLRALSELPGVERVASDEAGDVLHLGDLDLGRLSWRLVAIFRLREDSLIVETGKPKAAELLRRLLEHPLHGLARRSGSSAEPTDEATLRWETELARGLPGLRDPESLADPVAITRHLLRLRDEELVGWPDRPHPELDGRSPREAAAKAGAGRRRVELLLAELEHDQWPLPAGDRFDVEALRREVLPGA